MTDKDHAYILPFVVFMAGLLLVEVITKFSEGVGPLWLAKPQYWVYPLQAVAAGCLVWRFRRQIAFGPHCGWLFAAAVGIVMIAIWVSPQEVFGQEPRTQGFDPYTFDDPWLFWATYAMRFVRLVIVVPLVEEIFWRGFLMRYLMDPHFDRVPFGAFSWKSFTVVTLAFGAAHMGPDFWVALIAGAMFNLVAIRTKSLSACVVCHAVANLALGIYIVATRQWGFW